ncbi:MAG: hypothetical protein ACXIVQ_05000 [Acidimicrobiales bacterium]
MRILRLDLDNGDELDLHPYVSVLAGMSVGTQRRVVRRLEELAHGQVVDVGALVESHGLVIEVDEKRLGALGLSGDADLVVHAEQLPGARLLPVESTESPHERALRDRIAATETEIGLITADLERLRAHTATLTSEMDTARLGLDEFAITAHETAVKAVAETESFVRRRLSENADVGGRAVTYEPETDAERERAELAARLSEQRRRHTDLEIFLDEERLGLLEVLEQLEAERAHLDALRSARVASRASTESAPAPPPPPPPPPPAAEPAAPRPDEADMARVEAAIRAVAAGPPEAPTVPSMPAAALADQVHAHRQRQREVDAEMRAKGLDVDGLRSALQQARIVAREAEEAARPKSVSPEDSAEIERLHDIVTENADRRESRRGGKEATRLYGEASAQLETVLDRYGFPTYASYIMGRTAPSIDEVARRRHQDALAQIEELEARLASTTETIERDPQMRMLRSEHEQLWAAAAELLDRPPPEDIERALRELRVPGPVEFTAPDDLRRLLARLDVEVDPTASTGRLVEIADRWLSEARDAIDPVNPSAPAPDGLGITFDTDPPSAPATVPSDESDDSDHSVAAQERRVAELQARASELDDHLTERENEAERLAALVATIEAELVALDDRRSAAGHTWSDEQVEMVVDAADQLDAQLAADPAVRTAREQAALTSARLERHRHASIRVDQLHAEIGANRASERALGTQLESRTLELTSLRHDLEQSAADGGPLAPVEWTLTSEGIGPIEWYLLGRVASLRSVSAAGSVPLILHDCFRGLPPQEVTALCTALGRMGESVQVIYVGEEPAVVSWADQQGLDRAAVVRPGLPAV